MSNHYANLVVAHSVQTAVIETLNQRRQSAFVAGHGRAGVVVFHEDFAVQEYLAADLSATFQCAVLLGMVFGGTVFLYRLYVNGEDVDSYVSSPHDGLELDAPAPPGDAEKLCAAFGVEHRVQTVRRILDRPSKPNTDYAYAVNRHGELLRALGLPLIAAGTGFAAIESGELPHASGFDPSTLVRTGS